MGQEIPVIAVDGCFEYVQVAFVTAYSDRDDAAIWIDVYAPPLR